MYILFFFLALLAPAAMFLLGLRWKLKSPKFGGSFAYHTALSSRSQACWDFAHRHISMLWLRIGLFTGVLAAVLMLVLKSSYQSWVLWMIGGEMVLFCLSAVLVDSLLKSAFDEDGKPL